MAVEFEIFRAGTRTAGNGETRTFAVSDLKEISKNYDPKVFRAPLIITHNTFGVPDHKLADYSADDGSLPTSKRLAFGTPDRLKVVGDSLKAVFTKISPKFVELNRQGAILGISASLYKPDSPANPTPGKWSLRHIAGLGDEPPAVKGMDPLELTELEVGEWVASFSDSEEGVLSFSPFNSAVILLLQSLRDWIIDEKGLEVADQIMPKADLGILRQESIWADSMETGIMQRLNLLEDKVGSLDPMSLNHMEGKKKKMNADGEYEDDDLLDDEEAGSDGKKKKKMTFSEVPEFQEAIAALKQQADQLNARETALRKKEFADFCEGIADRLVPAIAPQTEVVAFMEYLTGGDPLVFGETTSTPLDWFKKLLNNLPPSVSLAPLPKSTTQKQIRFPQPSDYTFAEDQMDLHTKALAYCQQHSLNAQDAAQYQTAVVAVSS